MSMPHGRVRSQRGVHRLVATAVAITLAMVALAACGSGSEGDGGAGQSDTLTIGISQELASLNPGVDGGSSGAGFMLYLPYATLIAKDPDTGAYGPGLAESFGYVGTGNTTFELKLRPDAVFADGTPVDSEAVKTWLEYFPTAGGGFGKLLTIDSVETPDATTAILHLGVPSPLLPEYLAGPWGMVISPQAVADPEQLTLGAPGAGPYQYDQDSTVTGSSATYTLIPNEHFYAQDQITWSKIVVKVISDPAARLRAMQSGQLDVAMGTVDTIGAARAAGIDATASSWGWTGVSIIDSNGSTIEALADKRVRQALNYAIDREGIAQSLYAGEVEPTSELTSPDGFDPALQDAYPYDPEKAKELLAESGIDLSQEIELEVPVARYLQAEEVGQIIAAMLTEVGLNISINEMDFGSFMAKQTKAHDMGRLALLGLAWPTIDADGILTMFEPGNVYDYWGNEEFGDLLKKGRATTDRDAREAIYMEATKLMCEEAGSVFLYQQPLTYGLSNDFTWQARGDDWIRAMDMAPAE